MTLHAPTTTENIVITETVPIKNPYADIEYFTETGKFRVKLLDSRMDKTTCPTFDTLQEAMDARDQLKAEGSHE